MTFDQFQLFPAQQLLLENATKVVLGARALHILMCLVERAGEVVDKDQISAKVWPGLHVDESNLRVHIAALRRALRDGHDGRRYIVNVPGRGYSFVAPVHTTTVLPQTAQLRPGSDRRHQLPPALTRIIGRSETVAALSADLANHRFITLVGPGGIGKTTIALAVAHERRAHYRDGAAFIDLSASDHTVVPIAMAAVLGLAVTADDAIPAVIAFLRDQQMLLVLDSCEHVVETAAMVAEQIFSNAAGIHILATSLEPLAAAGERVHRLLPLPSPPGVGAVSAAEAMTFPGVQLFVERVASHVGGFELSDADAPFAAEICRRLDGIALAIELAAARVAAFGIRELAARLDDRLGLLTGGRRTAVPRHQTLAATLDWSYKLLSEPARKLLRHLGVISGEFTLEAVMKMVGALGDLKVLPDIAELVSKSLVNVDRSAEPTRYRLLDTTRLYAMEKLRVQGELRSARLLHAEWLLNLFVNAEQDCETLAHDEWMATYASQLDNLRIALDWAGSSEGDATVLVPLTAHAVPLWVQLSLMSESRRRVERALAVVEQIGLEREVKRCRMQLHAALGWALMYSAGRTEEIGSAWATTLQLADELGDNSYRLRALWGMWIGRINKGDWAAGLNLAKQLMHATDGSADALDRMMAERLFATTMHYRGDQQAAQFHMDRSLGRYASIGRHPRVARFQVDQRLAAHYFKARILWLLGYFDQARVLMDRNVDEGLTLGHALSFGSVLGQGACPITLFTGDLVAARRFGTMLLEHAQRFRLELWHEWAECFAGLITMREGQVEIGLSFMRAALDRAGDAALLPRYMVLQGEFASGLGLTGDPAAGLDAINGLIARCEANQEGWYLPEALRIKGELMFAALGDDAAAEEVLLRAERLARTQHARAWELRIALSLTRLGRDPGRSEDLGRLVRSFTEGFGTADLLTARDIASR